jgi:hypothetical protein
VFLLECGEFCHISFPGLVQVRSPCYGLPRTSTYACMPHHTGRIVVSYKFHIAIYNAFVLVIVFLEFILVSGAKAERFSTGSYVRFCSVPIERLAFDWEVLG